MLDSRRLLLVVASNLVPKQLEETAATMYPNDHVNHAERLTAEDDKNPASACQTDEEPEGVKKGQSQLTQNGI